jgi:hypothetical protein
MKQLQIYRKATPLHSLTLRQKELMLHIIMESQSQTRKILTVKKALGQLLLVVQLVDTWATRWVAAGAPLQGPLQGLSA